MKHFIISLLIFMIMTASHSLCAAQEPIGILRDFSDLPVNYTRSFQRWNWNPEQKKNAANFSREEAVADRETGKTVLKLTIDESFPWRGEEHERMVSLKAVYLPPVADVVRLTVRMVSGKISFSLGGPTVYFGHSDVHTKPLSLSAEDNDKWHAVEFDLNQGLGRNFRRAEWAREAPVVYYSRWIQEPLSIIVNPGSAGEIHIAKAEWISQGKGRPFPSVSNFTVKPAAEPLVFNSTSSLESFFTMFAGVATGVDFSKPPYAPRPDWTPPKIDFERQGKDNVAAVRSSHRGTEEACWTAIKIPNLAAADALLATIMAQHPLDKGLVKGEDKIILDFMLLAAPAAEHADFPWQQLAPPESWRNAPEAFNMYLNPSHKALAGKSFALFHARRAMLPDEWIEILLPMDDFACFYGQGAMEHLFTRQKSPQAKDIVFFAFLSPWQQNSAETTVLLSQIKFVDITGDKSQLRSYWQTGDGK